MVYVLVRVEICAKTAAGSGWDAFLAQNRNEEEREVTAVPNLALTNGSGFVKRLIIYCGYMGEFFGN